MAGRWYANKTDLSRYAYNVSNRAAGWQMPSKRGEDLIVPGRSGSKFNPDKPSDVGVLPLEMWAVGANVDGTVPLDNNRALAVRNNLDKLSRIFGDAGLIEMARTDDDAVEYGRRNLIPNPSFERTLGDVVVRENRVRNSSAEYSSGKVAVRRNLIHNPSFEGNLGKAVYRRNLAPNPRMAAQGKDRVVRTNWVTNPSFEANLKMWLPNPRVEFDRVRRDIGGRGPWVARVKCNEVGRAAIKGGGAIVEPNTTYTMQCKVKTVDIDRQHLVTMDVRYWTGSAYTAYEPVDGWTFDANENTSFTLSAPMLTPAGTKFAQIRLSLLNAEVGETVLWDEVAVTEGNDPDYFDGTMPDRDGLRYRWVDAGGVSTSEEFRTMPRGYTVTGNMLAGLSEREARRGHQSTRLWADGPVAQWERLFGSDNPTGFVPVPASSQVSASVHMVLHGSMGEDTVREVQLSLRCYDSDGDELGPAVTTEGGGTGAAEIMPISTDGWVRLELNGAWTLPGTAAVGIRLGTADVTGWVAGDSAYVDCTMVERGSFVGGWFDGATKDGDTFTYEWTGEKHWSPAIQVGRTAEWWMPFGCSGFQTLDEPRRGEQVYRLFPRPWIRAGQRMRARSFANHIIPGRTHRFSVYVRATRAHNVAAELEWVIWGGGKQVDVGATEVTAVGDWVRVSVTGVCPENASGVFCTLTSLVDPVDTDRLDLDCALLETTSAARPWFSGNSGDQYTWRGRKDVSESIYWRSKANGWSAYGSAKPTVYRLKTIAGASDGEHVVVAVANEPGNLGVSVGGAELDEDDPYTFAVDVNPSAAGVTLVAGIVWRTAKNAFISRSETTVVAVAGWQRLVVTDDPPATASFAAAYAYQQDVAADTEVRFDAAIFGFGGASDYKDGDNFSGWRWTGEKGLSSSEEIGEAILYWKAWDGTLEQSSTWSADRANSGHFVVTDGTNPRVSPHVPARWDERQFQIDEGETATFACQVRAGANSCRVRARLVAMTYDGLRYEDFDVGPVGEWLELTPGQVKRPEVTGIPIGVGTDYTHIRAQIQVQAPGGGPAALGTDIFLDEAVLSYGENNTYLDGTMPWTRWTAGADQSPSEVYGPARRCRAQVISGIAPESMAGGTRAEFSVEMQIPEVYWEDTWETTDDYPIVMGPFSVLALVGLKGMTAPIDDAVIELHGPFRNMRVKDLGSGAWVQINGKFGEDRALIIDNDQWTVKDRKGRSYISETRHGGHPRLLPLTCQPGDKWPRLELAADSVGADAFIRVTARRRYHIA